MQTNDHVGSREASDIIGVSHATFNRWAKNGRIPVAIKAPGKTGLRLFNRADIERIARKCEQRKRLDPFTAA